MYRFILLLCFALLMSLNSSVIASSVAFENSIGMKFVRIPSGSFMMGSPEDELGRDRNEDLHKVFITRSFYMAETEVTQGQWYKVMGYNPSAFNQCGADCPVERVTWFDCKEFIKRLNFLEKTSKYRLPTEAEWEYASRAGSKTAFSLGDITQIDCTGDPVLDSMGWYCANSGEREPIGVLQSRPVAFKEPNAWGLYDMHGNVQEWVLDSCEWRKWGWVGVITKTYVDGIKNPYSSKGSRRIIRGGSWNKNAKYARSANRSFYKPSAYRNSVGFRIIKVR